MNIWMPTKVNVDKATWTAFRIECLKLNIPASEVLASLIKGFLLKKEEKENAQKTESEN